MKMANRIKKYVVYILLAAMLLSNQMIVNAANIVLSSVSEIILSDNSVGEDVYLFDIMTLNDGKTYVGAFMDPTEYKYYYGVSNDLSNWDIKSPYFSIAYGNNIYAGISGSTWNNDLQLNYTLDGISWKKVSLQNEIRPYSIKFENGLFKLYGYDSQDNLHLCISENVENWIDITEDISGNNGVKKTIVSDGKIYTLLNRTDKFSIIAADAPTEDNMSMEWSDVEILQKDGYGMIDFYFDGANVGIMLYSIADFNAKGYASDYIYFVTSDFVNWSEKDWTKTYDGYSVFDCTSTEKKNVSVDEYVKTQIYPKVANPYEENGTTQKVLISQNSNDWYIDDVKISLNGNLINKIDQSNTEYVLDNGILFNKDKTSLLCYSGVSAGTEYTIPTGVVEISDYAFYDCMNLMTVIIPEGVTSIGNEAFSQCSNLECVVIPNSVTNIGGWAFNNWRWNGVSYVNPVIIYGNAGSYAETYASNNNIMFKDISSFSGKLPISSPYVYDTQDLGETVNVSGKLESVIDEKTAEQVIELTTKDLTNEQKESATGIDKMTVLAEGAVANVASTTKSEDTIHITETVVKELEPKAVETAETLEKTLTDNGVNTQRTITKTVKVKSTSSKKTVKVVKDTAETAVDTVKVETDFASVSIPASAQTEFELTEQDTNKVAVTFDTDKTTTMKISFPGVTGDTTYMAVVDETGKAIGGKYNPATGELEAKISESGVYSVVYNEKDFGDIKDKSAEMQNAIKTLAAKGRINGTSETTFSPDASISRAEIAALIVRTLSKLDPNEDGGFVDVTKDNWFFGVAGSSRKHGIINGYEDNTFRGNNVILKEQIIAVTARVLRNEMNYKTPENVSEYLTYTDAESLPGWAKEDIALAEMANIVLQRVDGQFVPQDEMTRGDAAIILMRLFNKIW